MELRGSQTEENLRQAFAGELKAIASYRYFAAAAKEAGFDQIADVFLATADNEAEHAEHEFKFLGGVGEVRANISQAFSGEHDEATRSYPEAAKVAEREGFTEIASFFRRMGKVEDRHEKLFRNLLEILDKGGEFKDRTVGHSRSEIAQPLMPNQANPAGYVHGGELMKLADSVAGLVAVRHCHGNVVLATVNDLTFHRPVRIGYLALARAKMVFTSRSSMEVSVEIEAENAATEEKFLALTADCIFIALSREGKPVEVPQLIVSTEEEERLFSEALARYQSRKAKPAAK